ncbi:MAG: alpha-L-fucosidase [Candidatus Pacebacteria bacterium]|nr:alpha-L-fucosidase [Candidatus Paceibacterota bacterium]
MSTHVPTYLSDYKAEYAKNPRKAALQWFRDAKYGLFIHYGLYSLLGRHEWVQHTEKISVADYAQLAHWFTAEQFDAEWICDFAVECGMKYVNLTTRHHDSFCLWDTDETTFNVMNTPCGRDLVGELARACEKKGLGLCLYYSHGRDWKHPHAPNNDAWGGKARPEYETPEPTYATGSAHNLQYYLDYMTAQITELLTHYGPIAAIWLDGIAVPLCPKDAHCQAKEDFDPCTDGDAFKCQELYDHIHSLQPQVLISYKQGYLGTEDFFAPEHKAYNRFGEDFTEKPGEICTTAGGGWGYTAGHDYCTADELWTTLNNARDAGCNLLINVGPLPDGRFPRQSTATLLEVGKRLSPSEKIG